MTDLLFLDEGRMLISEKLGIIWIARIDGNQDITEREVSCCPRTPPIASDAALCVRPCSQALWPQAPVYAASLRPAYPSVHTVPVKVYLDLTSVTSTLGDKGLLDMILDKDFAVTRQIYIYYSRNGNPCVVVHCACCCWWWCC